VIPRPTRHPAENRPLRAPGLRYDGRVQRPLACGASSAIMAINYYSILPYWDITCSWPYSHVSHYGQYVSRSIPTTASPTTSGRRMRAAIGLMAAMRTSCATTGRTPRDTCATTSSTMDCHRRGLVADLGEVASEVNSDDPCVVLNSLTSSGHYIVSIGYYTTQRTAVFNDPYGNKNTPAIRAMTARGPCTTGPGTTTASRTSTPFIASSTAAGASRRS